MRLRAAEKEEFLSVRSFYWELIDQLKDQEGTVGWKKGIYPSDSFLISSIDAGELYLMDGESGYLACVIANSQWNEGYEGLPWSLDCAQEEILVPHALAVSAASQGKGIGTIVVKDLLDLARAAGKKTVRLDILKGNTAAEQLYIQSGFEYVQTKTMFYEDTGWTEYMMYEIIL